MQLARCLLCSLANCHVAPRFGNSSRNNDPSDQQKTTRPGVIRTHDQGIMSPLL
jgi:hypothetical protein